MHHAKTDSEVTSIDASTTPPRSPRRPLYYVQSPSHSHHDAALEKITLSYDSSPTGSPSHHHHHHHYHCSSTPIHHSRESSTSRFSAALRGRDGGVLGWKKMNGGDEGEDGEEEEQESRGHSLRFYGVCFVVSFGVVFGLFSLILWCASKAYSPHIWVRGMMFKDFTVQAGMDDTGVPTDMLSLNSAVRILYKNPGTFFGVHVTSTPIELHYYQLRVASGQMKPFYQRRQTQRNMTTVVKGVQVPLYGAVTALGDARTGDKIVKERVKVDFNLTITVRSRAYILGTLVKSKFYKHIRCPVSLDGSRIGKPLILKDSCTYR